jgi:hypothetical protein
MRGLGSATGGTSKDGVDSMTLQGQSRSQFAKQIAEGKTVEAHVNYPNMLLDKTTIDSDEAKAYGLWGDAK